VKELFDKIIRGTNKMAVLIKNVLQYSRVGRAEIEMVSIDMSKMLHEIKEEILSTQRNRDVDIRFGELPDITGDRTMIMQLFSNLVGNAVKYSTNVETAKIQVEGAIKDNFVTYCVSDNGIGIDMKYANRIFELFRRLDNVKEIEGTGVGLAIAKRIIEKHNGKIWLESRPNSGTKFYVSIPVKNPENA
jgi:chemotaxis family two-component system sensor kinase Cph1